VQVVLERRAVARARRILVLSAFSRRLLLGRHPACSARVSVVRGGFEATFLEPPAEPAVAVRARHRIAADDLFLLTTRRLEPRMGLEELLAALAELDDPRVTLVLTGDGAHRTWLERLAGDLGVTERVRFAGRVSETELRALYGAADLFVLPTIAYEGFGMSTIEALASGTPVLGTAVGATPEILSPVDESLVVERADARALAEGIRRVVPMLGAELRSRCSAYAAERYAWGVVIPDWERALLDAAIDGRRITGNL
jgi:glycosyltransferase involved in cell wall biosynthesis